MSVIQLSVVMNVCFVSEPAHFLNHAVTTDKNDNNNNNNIILTMTHSFLAFMDALKKSLMDV